MLYKNWKAIYEIKDRHFKSAMVFLDIDSDFGKNMAKRFSEYFADEIVIQPVSWSVIQKAIRVHYEKYASISWSMSSYEKYPVSHGDGVLNDTGLPIIEFGDSETAIGSVSEIIDFIEGGAEFREIFTWKGSRIVFLEMKSSVEYSAYFVPEGFIDFDK